MATNSVTIKRSVGALQLQWAGGAAVVFELEAGFIKGIRDVVQDGLALRNPRKLWRPAITTPEGIHYGAFRFKEAKASGGGVTVRADAIGASIGIQEEQDEYLCDIFNLSLPDGAVKDELIWEFKPSRKTIGGHAFAGIAYRYRFKSGQGRKIYRIFDDASWEIGGKVEGNTLLLQGQVNPPVTELHKNRYFTTACNYYGAEMRGILGRPKRVSFQRLPRVATLQAFDCLIHARGALIGLFEPLVDVLSIVHKDIGEDVLHVLDEVRRPLGAAFSSGFKHILWHAADADWSREAQRNLWLRVYDHVHDGIRARYGVTRSPVQPRIWIPQYAKDTFFFGGRRHRRPRSLYVLADRAMATWAEMGVKEICIHSIWQSDYTIDRKKRKDQVRGMHGGLYVGSICNVREYEIDRLWGGADALAYFVRKAHAHGMQVQLWWSTHMSRRAPIFQKRPDFMLMARDGLPNGGGFGHLSIITYDLNNPDCFEWVFENLKKIHARTGFDGFFHDSYGNMTFLPMNYLDPLRRGQQEAYGRLVRKLQGIGIKTFTVEGIGPLGVGHFGMNLLPSPGSKKRRGYQMALDWWLGQEDMVYGLNMGISSRSWHVKNPSAREFAFRCLAAGGRFGFTGWAEKKAGRHEVWRGWLRDQNRMFGRITPLQGRRTLLPEGQGIIWDEGRRGQVLFAFSNFERGVPSRARVREITAEGEHPVQTSSGRFAARAWRVYRIA